ncbi:hypothetical protein [Galbitalea soli]|uniref:O-antigen ligase family protein n=1 Tax=Galbitalea soli TaxID=1268042 RepID=A0A7C9PLD7_9MICO|nr:hypothetical protein [Galbitalea soli]NEM89968.1 hypothetical protein [Galbitalea soli]NYJ30674.1 F0F1-type ATP synthase membrane subunit c/vacuolar-type H+-ATPase subunit K [Galbitalea soli]
MAASTLPVRTLRPGSVLYADTRLDDITVWIMRLSVALVGARIALPHSLDGRSLLALALLPWWLPILGRFVGGRLTIGVGVLGVANGLWLAALSASDHSISQTDLRTDVVRFAGLVAGVGVVLWARTRMRDSSMSLWFSLGLFIGIYPFDPQFSSNPWKFGIAVPTIVLVLAVAEHRRARWLEVLGLLALAGVCAIKDSRSEFSILLLTLVLVVWQLRPGDRSRRNSAVSVLVTMAGLALVVFAVGQQLILSGYLGQAAQQRSQAQIDSSGSIIVGGRPELAATLSLLQTHPLGFGSGVVPNLGDIVTAKEGMSAIGYQPDNGYVENYMFGGHIEVHSIVGDVWARYGWVGVLFLVLVLVFALRSVGSRIGSRTAPALVIFATVSFAWNFAFGPLLSSTPLIILFAGLALDRRVPPTTEGLVAPAGLRPGSRGASSRVGRSTR